MDEEVKKKISKLQSEITTLERKKYEIVVLLTQKTQEIEKLKTEYNLKRSLNLDKDWGSETFEWDEVILDILQKTFKLQEFRFQQKAAINLILSDKDVLLLMPTGGGKSLCYQLPAVYSSGLTVVISPLLALMEDQVIALKKLNIPACLINSMSTKEDKMQIYHFLNKSEGHFKIIYVTPEWLSNSKKFMNSLQKCHKSQRLARFAVDEVHCCSQWGHDFRPDYEFLSMLKHLFPDIPIIGLTATASQNVLLDVQKMLNIEGCPILSAPFDRKNLNFQVIQKPDDLAEIMDYVYIAVTQTYRKQCGIIYTVTISDAQHLAQELRKKGVRTYYYHGEMDTNLRASVHRKWLANEYNVIVATIAFGMGIDKPDVKYVIHYSVPKSLESFYQEAGRAGRNGEDADCIIMFRVGDYLKQSAYAKSSTQVQNCHHILKYCLNFSECRHYLLQNHFEGNVTKYNCKTMCNNCIDTGNLATYDISKSYREISSILEQTTESLTLKKLIDKWYKEMPSKSKIGKIRMANIIGNLFAEGYLKENRSYTAYTVNVYIQDALKPNFDKNSGKILVILKKNKELENYFNRDYSDNEEGASTSKKSKRK